MLLVPVVPELQRSWANALVWRWPPQDLAIEQLAVGDRDAGAVDFYVSESSWFSSLERDQVERFEAAQRISVSIVTLDGYCREHGIAPTCIKVDAEGHELQVLRGALGVLGQWKPDLVVEVSADPAIREPIWDLLAPLGYRVFVIAPDGLRPVPTTDRFWAAGPGDDHVDALFTADQTLGQRLEARLNN